MTKRNVSPETDLEWLILKGMDGPRELREVPDGMMLSKAGHELFVVDDLGVEPIDHGRFFAQHFDWMSDVDAAFILAHTERHGSLQRRSGGYYDGEVVRTALNTMREAEHTLLVKASEARVYPWFISYLNWLPNAATREVLDAGRISLATQVFGKLTA